MSAILLSTVLAAAVMVQQPQEDVKLVTASGTLQGTLLLPASVTGKIPVALIIAGSGPTDRDGNSPLLPGKNESLKMVAQALAAQGIASVRYDKRGVAASGSSARSETELRFTNYIDDAIGWINQLKADPRFSSVIIVGHSEGSLIGLKAAQATPVAGFISLAGAGRSLADVIDEQLAKNLPAELKADAARIMIELRQGRTVAEVPQTLAMIFRPSVQPYLISQITINPGAEIAKVKVPVLIVQGTADAQVGVIDAETLSRGNPKAQLAIVNGMNHVLKEIKDPSQQIASYSDPNLPLHPELSPLMVKFVKEVTAITRARL